MDPVYRKGDATAPIGVGPKVLVHVCNDAGKWGKGFVLAVSERWSEPEAAYRAAFESGKLELGEVQLVRVAHKQAPEPMRDATKTPKSAHATNVEQRRMFTPAG